MGSITVELGGKTIVSTTRAWRVLETSHPPTYYLPREAVAEGVLRETSGSSWCKWKGQATYYDLVTDTRSRRKARQHPRRHWASWTTGFALFGIAVLVVERAGARTGGQRAQGPLVDGVIEATVAHVAGRHRAFLARRDGQG